MIRTRRLRSLALVVLIGSATLLSCGGWPHVVRSEATDDLKCPEESIEVIDVDSPGIWEAKGCGQRGRYQCWTIPHGGPHCRRVDD